MKIVRGSLCVCALALAIGAYQTGDFAWALLLAFIAGALFENVLWGRQK